MSYIIIKGWQRVYLLGSAIFCKQWNMLEAAVFELLWYRLQGFRDLLAHAPIRI